MIRKIALAALFLSPMLAECAAITVNTVCELGNCASPDSLSLGQSTSGSFNFTYTFVNGDKFSITGAYSAAFPGGTNIFMNPVATYIGASPSVGTDVLSIDLLQNYFFATAANWDGTYVENVRLILTSPGTVQAQVLYDGQSVGLVGPFGPGSNTVSNSKALTGLNGPTLSADYSFVYTFAAGAVNGASASSPVPEPAQTALFGFGLLATMLLIRERKYGKR